MIQSQKKDKGGERESQLRGVQTAIGNPPRGIQFKPVTRLPRGASGLTWLAAGDSVRPKRAHALNTCKSCAKMKPPLIDIK